MMLEPSIDKLLEKVDSKYSLVILEAKRAHELRDGERPTKYYLNDKRLPSLPETEKKGRVFKAVKHTLQALDEIADGSVTIHPAPDAKRKTLQEKRDLEHLRAKMKEKQIKEQIAKEEADEESKQKGGSRAAKAAAVEAEQAGAAESK